MDAYITIPVSPGNQEPTWNDMFQNYFNDKPFVPPASTFDTATYKKPVFAIRTPHAREVVTRTVALLHEFWETNRHLKTETMQEHYTKYFVPKRDGGRREINDPDAAIRNALGHYNDMGSLCWILNQAMYATYHTCAFAYVQNRCAKFAVQRHANKKSRWFLKTDLSNFFGSITLDCLVKMMKMCYPWCLFNDEQTEILRNALSLAFLNGVLPQGSTASPMLTNILMIPVDYTINKFCHEYTKEVDGEQRLQPLVYTRYADDIYISSKYQFDWKSVLAFLRKTFADFEMPLVIKDEKTRYVSNAGRNWILGVMYNKDCQITVGHKRKKRLKTCIFQFMQSIGTENQWSPEDAMVLQGQIAYCRNIEPDATDKIVEEYSQKFNKEVASCLKRVISGR